MGMGLFCLLWIIFTQSRRNIHLEKCLLALMNDMAILTTAKQGDYTTSRIMAQVAKSKLSAGALETPKEEIKKETYSILQTAE